MSKYLLCADIHWSEFSSIVRSIGDRYSTRLERCIASLNWLENLAIERGCDEEFFLGDFFDQSSLNASEISALREVHWNALPKKFLVGNHEAADKSLAYNSVNALSQLNNFTIISEPQLYSTSDTNFLFIPYYLDNELKTLSEYWAKFPELDPEKSKVVLSHNSIKGLFYGKVLSTQGFEISDIENNCDLFLNGHLHNCGKICQNGLNLGNLVGQNFNEDANKYPHCAYILDTESYELTTILNPESLNFYQFDMQSAADFCKLNTIRPHSVVAIKCNSELLPDVEHLVSKNFNILASRITAIQNMNTETATNDIGSLHMNHLDEFIKFCKNTLDNSPVLDEELSRICED